MAKVKEYVVVALSCSGKNGAVYRNGDTVKETDFPPGHAEAYVVDGHMKYKDDNAGSGEEATGSKAIKKAADAIEAVNALTSVEEVNTFVRDENRATVKAAAIAKVKEIEEATGGNDDLSKDLEEEPAIAKIAELETAEEVNAFVEGEEREPVKESATKRIEELSK